MHTQFLLVIKYTSGEFRGKMGPVLRLIVMVMVLLSAGPTSGAWYPPGQYYAGWPQYGGALWPADVVFQQQHIYLLETQVTLLKQQTSQQQLEIDQLKHLQEKVKLLETLLGANLTADGASVTDCQSTTIERLTTIEENQKVILAQQQTFQQQNKLYNRSMQSLSNQLKSLEDEVNRNIKSINGIHETLAIHEQHGEQLDHQETVLQELAIQLRNQSHQLLHLLETAELHANTIGGPLNNSSATLANSLAEIELRLTEYKTELDLKGVELEDVKKQTEQHSDQLEHLNESTQEITDIKDHVETVVQLLNRTTQVAFSVKYSTCGDVNLGKNGVVKYDVVETNIGEGYSPKTGCFTAAVNGVYFFYTSLRSTNNHGYITVGIFKGARKLVEATADGKINPFNRGTALVTCHLDVRDEVCVKHTDGWTFIDASSFTTFSGMLVNADID